MVEAKTLREVSKITEENLKLVQSILDKASSEARNYTEYRSSYCIHSDEIAYIDSDIIMAYLLKLGYFVKVELIEENKDGCIGFVDIMWDGEYESTGLLTVLGEKYSCFFDSDIYTKRELK